MDGAAADTCGAAGLAGAVAWAGEELVPGWWWLLVVAAVSLPADAVVVTGARVTWGGARERGGIGQRGSGAVGSARGA